MKKFTAIYLGAKLRFHRSVYERRYQEKARLSGNS
jgi:hypothetical protein